MDTDRTLSRHKRDWEQLGADDPLWAVLTDPQKRGGKWDPGEFLRTGEQEIDDLMRRGAALGHPGRFERALDFGCGAGRLTRAMSSRFAACVGVDISGSMIAKARELNADRGNCTFVVSERSDLSMFPSAEFDLVYSNIVLQHQPTEALIRGYIAEFVRVLRPGGLLAFQVPSGFALIYRFRLRRRWYDLLRALGSSEARAWQLGGASMRMTALPESEVAALLGRLGATLLTVSRSSTPAMEDRTYYATRPGS